MKLNLKKGKEKIKKTSKTSIVLTILVFIILITMGVGYAVLEQDVFIFGNSKIESPDYRIYISDIKISLSNNGGYETSSPTMTDNEIGLYATLNNDSSFIIYEVTIKNTGKTDAIVDYIYTSNNNESIKFKIIGTHPKDVVRALSTKTIKIAIEPTENKNIQNEMAQLLINFNFIKKEANYSNECILNWDGTSKTEPISTTLLGTSYYRITNANEFKWFVDEINNGNTSINAILMKDICLNNNNIKINNNYIGILDGQNRTIKDISYNRDENKEDDVNYNAALFMNNSGTIKNLNVIGKNADKHTVTGANNNTRIGGIVVTNAGIIENCSYKGQITLDANARVNCLAKQGHSYNYIGGIASNNTGIIRGSYNNAIFDIKGTTAYGTCNIYSRSVNIYAGGITGENTGYIIDSYNNANMNVIGSTQSIERATYNGFIGAIAGTNTNICKNAYNTGQITQTITGNKGNSSTGIIASNSGEIKNIYYLAGMEMNKIGTEVAAADLINLNLDLGNAFLKDTNSINNGYPILFWE